ncbi:type VII secretion integral membrane protein EccD [uncultured Corynebacterium sp.]|uniref:type VII secretion integral membrane protein EccD n=1 Tax=uncultured Corynebacterium sp. TaxID=159447 RepID=UPI0025E47622|nr:type VII secretion integral membrane protein EccD [uncultured Corynebacterium sp.]
MTRALAHSIHVTVRIHAGHIHKEADVSLPLSSSIGEVLGELLVLVDVSPAPILWRATTAAGKSLSMTAPLERTPLEEGSVLVLSPSAQAPAPIVRDAAEALAATGGDSPLQSLTSVWGVAGIAGTGGLAAAAVSPVVGAGIAACVALVLSVWTRRGALLAAAHVAAGLAGWFLIGGAPSLDVGPELSAALAAAACAVAIVAVAAQILRLGGLRARSIAATWCGLVLVGLLGPAPILAASVLVLASAPVLTTRIAGLRVPQLPTAGQDLSVSDSLPTDNDAKAQRAAHAYEGVTVGCVLAGLPALLHLVWLATSTVPAWAAQALCVGVGGGVIIHAARHARTVAAWALGLYGVAAALAAVAVAARVWQAPPSPTPTTWVLTAVAGVIVLAALSAPVWAEVVGHLEPTTIVWFERAEALALAACLPLAAHLAGLFDLIRGLG